MERNPALDDLNTRVTEAIFRSEEVPPESPEAAVRFRAVSALEEEIAKIVPADDLEGAIARVGAVTAAIDAQDWERAGQLVQTYAVGAPDDLAEELRLLEVEVQRRGRGLISEPAALG